MDGRIALEFAQFHQKQSNKIKISNVLIVIFKDCAINKQKKKTATREMIKASQVYRNVTPGSATCQRI